MGQKELESFLKGFIEKESLFKNKKALQSAFMPETIVHREKEVKLLANILAPSLKTEKPSNLFIYGKPGTGKTLTTKYITKNIINIASQNNVPVNLLFLNCKLKKIADTEYRIVAQLARDLGKAIPTTGLPTEEVYKIFFEAIDSKSGIIIIVLDEIDQLVKKA